MSDFSLGNLMSQAKSYVFGEEAEAHRNLKVRLQDEYSTEINGDTVFEADNGAILVPTGQEHGPAVDDGKDPA